MLQPEPARILLLMDGSEQETLASTLRSSLATGVACAQTLGDGVQLLGRHSFQLVLLEEALALSDSAGWDALCEACSGILMLELNFAMVNQARIIRQVRSALARQARYEDRALLEATRSLRDELSGPVAGLLLQSQLLLAQSVTAQSTSLRQIVTLAETLSHLLRVDPGSAAPRPDSAAG